MMKSVFYLLSDFLNFWFLLLIFLKSEISLRLFCKWLLKRGSFFLLLVYISYFFFYLRNLFEYYLMGTVMSWLSWLWRKLLCGNEIFSRLLCFFCEKNFDWFVSEVLLRKFWGVLLMRNEFGHLLIR